MRKVLNRLERAWWSLPIAMHYSIVSVVFLIEAINGAPNPRSFENIKRLRHERLTALRKGSNLNGGHSHSGGK